MGVVEPYVTANPAEGRIGVTHEAIDRFRFKVPTLRNVELTYPYFHDGEAETLAEAIDVMGRLQLGNTFTPEESAMIVAFLKTLTGDQPRFEMPLLPPSTPETPRPVPFALARIAEFGDAACRAQRREVVVWRMVGQGVSARRRGAWRSRRTPGSRARSRARCVPGRPASALGRHSPSLHPYSRPRCANRPHDAAGRVGIGSRTRTWRKIRCASRCADSGSGSPITNGWPKV